MARQARNEEKADNPVKLKDSTKSRLADWADKKKLKYFDDAVTILLDIAEKFGEDIEIQTEPSITIKGKEESGNGVHSG
jgi:hypothetical protein